MLLLAWRLPASVRQPIIPLDENPNGIPVLPYDASTEQKVEHESSKNDPWRDVSDEEHEVCLDLGQLW